MSAWVPAFGEAGGALLPVFVSILVINELEGEESGGGALWLGLRRGGALCASEGHAASASEQPWSCEPVCGREHTKAGIAPG